MIENLFKLIIPLYLMEKLHPGARWQFRFIAYSVLIFLSFFTAWFIVPVIAVFFSFISGGLSSLAIVLSIFVYLILIVIIGEIYARMAYSRWHYEFTPTNLKLERGIIWKKYSNIPYERVQNVDISRGILARIFGFSTVNIQTAGFHMVSYGRGMKSEGHIPAVSIDNAEKIREFLMKKIGKKQGL